MGKRGFARTSATQIRATLPSDGRRRSARRSGTEARSAATHDIPCWRPSLLAVTEGDWIKERDDWDVRPRPSGLVESWIEVAAPSTGSLGNHAHKKAVGDGTAYESWCCSPVGWR